MRSVTQAVILMLALAVFAMPGVAQSVPPGSYQQTCTDINVVNGSTLAARCQDNRGGWQSTRLTNIQDCRSDIMNDNGSLRCDRSGNAYYRGGYQGGYQGGTPVGDYSQTCRDIRTHGNNLEAECQTRDGNWRRTSLRNIDQCSNGISNDDGRLVCAASGGYGYGYPNGNYGGYQGNVPPGDYAQTCRNIHTEGNRLEAECQRQDGRWRKTSLDNVNQCSGGILNNDGRLVCAASSGYGYGYPNGNYGGYQRNVPPGSYTQTCRNIRTDGNHLEADCQTRSGDWRHTSIDGIDRCASAIANDDGHLMCGR